MSQAASKATNGSSKAANGRSSGGDFIRLRGVRVHNLRNLDLDIPRDRLVVITGPSGSGKSSLAFDTLFAEGQRQYIESLSVYARQFLHQLERPDVDSIDGLQPTISIDQQAGTQNPRSTVATVTEIYDYLRLLFARNGLPHCYRCGSPIRQQSPEQIVEALADLANGSKVLLLAPLVSRRKGQHQEVFDAIRKAGFVRARVDGAVHELDAVPARQGEAAHDRSRGRSADHSRRGADTHCRKRAARPPAWARVGRGGGSGASADSKTRAWTDLVFSTQHACPICGLSYEELEPRTFSFNSPYGACRTCDGLGAGGVRSRPGRAG